jgi:hypothetical protein
MRTTRFSIESRIKHAWALAAAALCATSLGAQQNVYVMSYQNATPTSGVTPCVDSGPSCHTGTSVSFFGSTAVATPTPAPPVTSRRTVYHYSEDGSWSVRPGDYTAYDPVNNYYTAPLQTNAVYKIYIAKANASASSNIVVNVTVDQGSLADTNGVGMTAVPTAAFSSATPQHQWIFVAYLTNVVPNPIVTFTYVSGTVNNSGNRWYTDVVRFEKLDPCAGVADPPQINGPLAAGQSFVNVAGIVPGATNVTVYANSVEIGQTNDPAGLAPGQVTVATSAPLNAGDNITARQTATNALGDACVSELSVPVPVGSGANPIVQVSLGLWQSSQFAGPVGADTTANLTNLYFLKASGLASGFNTAPTGGAELTPGICWQTVTFQNVLDDAILPNSAAHFTNYDAWCALEGLIFSISQTVPDSGPYEIYVDQIMNGDVLIEGFEGYTNGAVVMFNTPNASPTPNPAVTYLTDPNDATVSSLNAAEGTNSLRIRWQFKDNNTARWAHIRANAGTGKFYPQLDATKPITIRYLVLPVGSANAELSLPVVPQSQTKTVGQSVTFSVTAAGTPPYSYQWHKDGVDISGADADSYTIPSVALSDAGAYSVTVQDPFCTLTSPAAILTVNVPTAPVTITGIAGTTLSYTGGAGARFVLLQSSNISTPLSAWTRVATNTTTPGAFTIPAVGTPPSPVFYSIQSE